MFSTLKSANRLWQSPVSGVLRYAIVMVGLVWLTIEGASEMGYNWQWYQIPRYFYRVIVEELMWGPLATGMVITIEISLYSMLLTLVLGLLTALLRMSNSLSGQVLARVYLETIRNTPMLVQIYVFYFVIAPVLGIDRFWTGVLCLGLFEGSFASEIIRAGINSVPRGQWEAASSVGLSRFSSYRYVVLPQAIPLMLPPMTGVLINLIKHSAIVSVIAVFELTTEGRNIIADTYMAFEVWLTVAGIYLVLTVSLSICVGYLERRLRQPA